MSEMPLSERIASRTALVSDLLAAGRPLCVAWSGGKDSSACLAMAVEGARLAHERSRTEGLAPPAPLYVITADTQVENPAVAAYHERMAERLQAYARSSGVDIRYHVSKPSLAATWQVKILSGRSLPVFANSKHRDCSYDLKRLPTQRLLKRLTREAQAAGMPKPVTIVGTRYGESNDRDQRMRARGDVAGEIRANADGEPVLPLIADWTADDVWEYLGLAGPMEGNEAAGRVWPAFTTFEETVDIYRDAAGECVIVQGERGQQAAACGARHGCAVCTVVGTDKSMETMLMQAKYAYMEPLNRLRDYLVATRFDWSRRRWVPRLKSIDPVSGYMAFGPDSYHPQECARLMGMMLSIQADEINRARQLGEDIMAADRAAQAGEPFTAWRDPYLREAALAGEELDYAYMERMTRPQFHLVSAEMLVLVDFMWARYGGLPPFHALHIYDQVFNKGLRFPVPEIAEVSVEATPTPPRRWMPAHELRETMDGLWDPLQDHLQHERCFETGHAVLGNGQPVAHVEKEDGYAVDPEALGFILNEELPDLLERHARAAASMEQRDAAQPDDRTSLRARDFPTWDYMANRGQEAVHYYLRMGLALPRHQVGTTHAMMQHTQMMSAHGFDAGRTQDYPAGTISDAEHKDLKATLTRVMGEMGLVEETAMERVEETAMERVEGADHAGTSRQAFAG